MDLSPYLESLRRELAAAAAPGGEQVAQTAQLLATALDASARLCLIEVLADATAEITAHLDGPVVEVRLRGREADIVVTQTESDPAPAAAVFVEGGDQARLTLRLPEQLKEAVEKAAGTEGISVNSWIGRAVTQALYSSTSRHQGPPNPPRPHHGGRSISGFAQA